MISRTAFTQLRRSPALLAVTIGGMGLVYLAPPVLALRVHGMPGQAGALAWLLMSGCYLPTLRYYQRSPLWAPLLPLVALFYTGATIYSAISHWRGVGGMWKGRTQGRGTESRGKKREGRR